jgi:phosphoribosylanthranilate isomerase
MFGPSFGKGMYESDQAHMRQRMELAKAFEEFKQNNPYATAADYQAWIDMSSGTNNYLRGGLPGREVLGRLEQEGQERKRQAEIQSRLTELKTQAEMDGQYEVLTNNFLDSLSENDNLDEARQRFRQRLGPAAQGFDIDRRITPEAIDRRMMERTMSVLPQVMALLENVEDGDTGLDAKEIARRLNIDQRIAERARLLAERQMQDRRNKDWYQNMGNWTSTAASMAAAGASVEEITEHLSQAARMPRDAVRGIVERAAEQADNTRRNTEAQQRRALRDYVLGDPTLVGVIKQNNPDEAVRRILEIIRHDAWQFSKPEDQAKLIYRDVADSINSNMEQTFQTNRAAIPQQIETRRQALSDQSRERAAQVAGEVWQKSKPESGGMGIPFNTTIQTATAYVGTQWDLTNPGTAAGVQRALIALNKSGSLPQGEDEIARAIINHPLFRATATTVAGAMDAEQRRLESRNPEPKSWNRYLQESSSSIDQDVTAINGEVDNGLKRLEIEVPPTEIDLISARIEGMKAKVDNEFALLASVLDEERRSASIWLQAGGERYNDGDVAAWMRFLEDQRARMHARLDERLLNAQATAEKLQQSAAPAAQPQPGAVPPQTGFSQQVPGHAPGALAPQGQPRSIFDTIGEGLSDFAGQANQPLPPPQGVPQSVQDNLGSMNLPPHIRQQQQR